MIKTATIVGDVIGKYHPHGLASIEPVMSNLVDYGILDSQGDFGCKYLTGVSLPAASTRYTEARISKKYYDFFDRLMSYVPFKDSDIEGYQEPVFLPTPIPICLTTGLMGIGLGYSTHVPAFTMESIYRAWVANDPMLLEAPEGLILVKEESELDKFWTTGKGRITYTMSIEESNMDGFGFLVKGSTLLYQPTFAEVDEWIEDGQVWMRDVSDDEGKKLFIAKVANMRKITNDELYDMIEDAVTFEKTYRLRVTNGKKIYPISMKAWIDETMKAYTESLTKYSQDKIESLKFDITSNEFLPKVVQCLQTMPKFSKEDLEGNPDIEDEFIMKETKVPADILVSILRKSLSTLKKSTDTEGKIASLKKTLAEFEKFNPETEVENIIFNF